MSTPEKPSSRGSMLTAEANSSSGRLLSFIFFSAFPQRNARLLLLSFVFRCRVAPGQVALARGARVYPAPPADGRGASAGASRGASAGGFGGAAGGPSRRAGFLGG